MKRKFIFMFLATFCFINPSSAQEPMTVIRFKALQASATSNAAQFWQKVAYEEYLSGLIEMINYAPGVCLENEVFKSQKAIAIFKILRINIEEIASSLPSSNDLLGPKIISHLQKLYPC
jgi:hypothetical protein